MTTTSQPSLSITGPEEDVPTSSPGRVRSLVPNVVTAANISMGFAAVMVASEGRYEVAVYLLYVAIVLDILDGRIARWLNATSEIGQQLDSFCDAVSFGVAPAILVYRSILAETGRLGFLVALGYLLAGIFRLARYNLITDAHSKSATSIGVPIPIGAGFLMAIALMRDHLNPWIALSIVVFIAGSMVSNWEMPNLKGRNIVTFMLLGGMLTFTTVVMWPNWNTVACWTIWNVAILLVAKRPQRG